MTLDPLNRLLYDISLSVYLNFNFVIHYIYC